jgi:hypothetical protein
LLLVTTPALATTGLQWKFPAEGRRFHLMTRVSLPDLMQFNAEKNIDVRVAQVLLETVTNCVPGETLKSSWRLNCTLEDVSIQATPYRGETGDLAAVLAEYDERLTGKIVQVDFAMNGKVRDIDLEGYDKHLKRTAAIQENLRLLFARAFALIDLELPKKGDDKGKGYWKQDNLLAVGFPSPNGTMGSVKILHTIDKTEGTQVSISSKGNGIVFAGETVMVQSQERPKNTYDFSYSGHAVFDTAEGVLVSRDYVAKGIPTADSAMAESGALPYVQAAVMDRITGPAPTLPPTGILDPTK